MAASRVHMAYLVFKCPEVALVVAQFCASPDITATYAACTHYSHWFRTSNVRNILPVLWNINQIGEIVVRYMDSCLESGYVDSDSDREVESDAVDRHEAICASLYNRYSYLMDRLMCGWPLDGSPHLCYEDFTVPLELWTEDEVRGQRGSESFFLVCLQRGIIEDQLLPMLHRLQLTRRAPSDGLGAYSA